MLAQVTQTQPQAVPVQFMVSDVQRVDNWLTRECPECHHTGYVSIYPNREAETLNYITGSGWVCKPCMDIRREVDRNFYERGGDALVSGY